MKSVLLNLRLPRKPWRGRARLLKRSLVATLLAPTVALAGLGDLNDGTYDAFDCTPKISDQRIVLKGNSLSFYETNCDLDNPQRLKNFDGAVVLEASCNGEGNTWTTHFILMQMKDGGMFLMGERWGDRYQRCD